MSDCVLVLGAGGFVGNHLVQSLARRGERVIAVSSRPLSIDIGNVESIVCQANEPQHFTPLLARSRYVVHVASKSTPGSSAGNVMRELEGNLRPTLALLQALQQMPEKGLLYLSSGGSLYKDDLHGASAETAAVAPRSYHGAGKIAAEHFISAWCGQYGSAATILRPSNIYGPGQTERAGFGIIPTGFGKIARQETLTVWGDGSAVRDYLYIDDFVELCSDILMAPLPSSVQVLNAGSGIGVSLEELFSAMESVSGHPLLRTYDHGRKVDASRVVLDTSLAKERYNWVPKTPLNEGLKQTWAWFNTFHR